MNHERIVRVLRHFKHANSSNYIMPEIAHCWSMAWIKETISFDNIKYSDSANCNYYKNKPANRLRKHVFMTETHSRRLIWPQSTTNSRCNALQCKKYIRNIYIISGGNKRKYVLYSFTLWNVKILWTAGVSDHIWTAFNADTFCDARLLNATMNTRCVCRWHPCYTSSHVWTERTD